MKVRVVCMALLVGTARMADACTAGEGEVLRRERRERERKTGTPTERRSIWTEESADAKDHSKQAVGEKREESKTKETWKQEIHTHRYTYMAEDIARVKAEIDRHT